MPPNPISSLAAYSQFVAAAVQHRCVLHSTVQVWSDSPYTGIAEGEVHSAGGRWLRMREELDFEAQLITAYGYEFYRGTERLAGTTISPTRKTRRWPERFRTISTFRQIYATTASQRRK